MTANDLPKGSSNIKEQLQSLLENNVEYYKLWGFKAISRSAASFIKIFAMMLFSSFIFFFLATAAGFALGDYLGSTSLGFLCAAGVSFLLILALFLFRKKLVDKPLLKHFSKIYFKED